jgi:peptide/nickel transport system permease protein
MSAAQPDARVVAQGMNPALGGVESLQVPEGDLTKKKLGIGAWLAIGWLVLIVLAAVLAPVLPLDDPNENFASIARQGPGSDGHLLGGDANGRDMLSRIIFGSRSSLVIGVAAVAAGMLVGGGLGLIAGYYRGKLDTFLTGMFDILLAFPQLVLALALVSFLRGDPQNPEGFQMSTQQILIIALGIVSIPILGRITRASTLTWSQREFVLAARAQGAKNSRIILRDVLPNVLPAMFSIALLGVAVAIIAEGGLALLGVGTQPPTPSLGNIIAEGRNQLSNAPHIVFIPSIVIFLISLSLNYLGDVIRQRTDVRESAL